MSFNGMSRTMRDAMERRKHCCGLQGFNVLLGDKCPACEQDRAGLDELAELNQLRRSAAGRGTEARYQELLAAGYYTTRGK